jgi:hypothetical protein
VSTALKPAYLWVPDRVGSYGDEAVDLARMAGRELDPEQRLAVDAMLSYGPGGRPVALESVIVEARQNGKTGGVLLPVVLFDLFLGPPDRIVWTAHLFKTSRDAFADFVGLIRSTPELDRRVKRFVFANGEEAIELTNGASLEFLARSKGGGRGLGGKRLVMDEALFLSAESMGALIPTLSARQDPQINYGSSAGYVSSDHLRNLRRRGRAGGDPTLVYIEHCAPGSWTDPGCASGRRCTHVVGTAGCALDNEALWPLGNHTLGKRITYEYVRSERRALPPAEFGRERLGWWEDPSEDAEALLLAWSTLCVDPMSVAEGRPVFAVDVSPGSRCASIVSATWRPDGLPHVELVEHQLQADWVVERCQRLQEKHDPLAWVLAPDSPAGALLPDFAAVGIEPRQVAGREMGQACEAVSSAVLAGEVRHLGDPLFAAAFAGSTRRDIGDGLWAWSRRRSGADICPLVGATEALWVLSGEEGELGPDDIGVWVF